jgi:hypothetical protein
MTYKLVVSIHAQEDIKNGVDYYDAINPDLGDQFLAEIDSIYNKLQLHPQY